jgi:citronellol/citronellal dehydrogenase
VRRALPATSPSGRFLIDEDVLREAGITDFTRYAVNPGAALRIDLFLDERA